MKRDARRYGTTAIVVSVLVSGWLVLAACSDQKEGDRCESKNNNSDCAAGLICTTTTGSSERCCPQDRTRATDPACQISTPSGDSAPPQDTGPPPAPDSGGDADSGDAADANDADADASDAPTDG